MRKGVFLVVSLGLSLVALAGNENSSGLAPLSAGHKLYSDRLQPKEPIEFVRMVSATGVDRCWPGTGALLDVVATHNGAVLAVVTRRSNQVARDTKEGGVSSACLEGHHVLLTSEEAIKYRQALLRAAPQLKKEKEAELAAREQEAWAQRFLSGKERSSSYSEVPDSCRANPDLPACLQEFLGRR